MVDVGENPELRKIKFVASIGAPLAKAGTEDVSIRVTLSCPAGIATGKDRPFVRAQRTDGGGRVTGVVTLVERGHSAQVSEEDAPLVVQLANDGIESASNLWFFDLSLAPLPGHIFYQIFAGYAQAAVQAAKEDARVFRSTSALRLAVQTPITAPPTPSVHVLTPEAVPRLCVGLNTTTPPPLRRNEFKGLAKDALVHDVPTIAKIVAHIAERVRQPLDAIWSQQGGKALPVSPLFPDTPEGIADANEFWARQVTEMTVFTPYGGPTVTYLTGTNRQFLCDHITDAASDKFYGITMACENLATFAVCSRGTNPFARFPLEAGSVSSKVTKDAGGKWFIAKTKSGAASASETPALQEVPAPDGSPHAVPGYLTGTPNVARVDRFGEQVADDAYFGPGSVILFSNRPAHPHDPDGYNLITSELSTTKPLACRVEAGVEICAKRKAGKLKFTGPFRTLATKEDGKTILADHTAGAHIGAVLRISPDRKKVQTLDTGGLSVAGRDGGTVSILGSGRGFHTGNLDDALTNKVKSVGGEPLRGVGAFARITAANKAQFEKQLSALMKARPIGLVRLALMPAGVKVTYKNAVKPASGWLIFLSPLLPMYAKKETENFHISRYLWSLRDAPGYADGVEAWWLFYAPRGALARAMIDDTARSQSLPELIGLTKGLAGPSLKKLTIPIMNAKVEPSGRVLITNNKFNNQRRMHRIHHAEGHWSGSQLPMDQFFSLKPGTPASAFPPEIVPPGTPQMDVSKL